MSVDCSAYGVYEAARELQFCHRHEVDEWVLLLAGGEPRPASRRGRAPQAVRPGREGDPVVGALASAHRLHHGLRRRPSGQDPAAFSPAVTDPVGRRMRGPCGCRLLRTRTATLTALTPQVSPAVTDSGRQATDTVCVTGRWP
jgi:hypothetical protein